MAGAAIVAEGLGKRYRLGERAAGYVTLREKLSERLRGRGGGGSDGEVWALRDLDLEVAEGAVVGIVGRNGAGKSTFLKTVASITRPTTGLVRVRGRVGALLEVGTGFHPELTGRENVFLNGVVLGMSRREVRRRFDEIVEFSGVERFLDTPLKRYSSGMYLRLAFAVAAHLEPEVVIVDEVLAVGDAEFQRKCLGRMSELGTEGRTVLFVSHDLGAVGQLCPRAVWLADGRVRADGAAEEILAAYLQDTVRREPEAAVEVAAGSPVQDVSLALVGAGGWGGRRDEPLTFELRFTTLERIPGLDAAVYLLDRRRRQVLSENTSDRRIDLGGEPREHRIRLTIPPVLPAGEYVAGLWLGDHRRSFVHHELLHVELLPCPDDRDEALRRDRVVQPPVEWTTLTP